MVRIHSGLPFQIPRFSFHGICSRRLSRNLLSEISGQPKDILTAAPLASHHLTGTRTKQPDPKKEDGRYGKRLALFAYGLVSYLVFFLTFVYAVGFMGNLYSEVDRLRSH